MFHRTSVAPETPRTVRAFVGQVVDMYLADVHAMLRLPRPEVNITEACNFAIAAVLLNVISGVSVMLYRPGTSRGDRGNLFRDTAKAFYPWDAEPPGAIADPDEGTRVLYTSFRNPLAHSFGRQDAPDRLKITRFKIPGFTEEELDTIERALRTVQTSRCGIRQRWPEISISRWRCKSSPFTGVFASSCAGSLAMRSRWPLRSGN